MKNWKVLPALAALSIALSINPVAAALSFELFGVTASSSASNPNTLVSVDVTNGAQTLVGGLGSTPNSRSVDWDPVSMSLYGADIFDSPGVIQQIDRGTGVATPVATVRDGVTPVQIGPIAFAPNGVLYGVSGNTSLSPRRLGTIDLNSESFTPLLDLPLGQRVAAMDIAPDGTLYAVYVESQVQSLVSIDLDTLNILDEVTMTQFAVDDIDFAPDGNLYHSNFSFALFLLDANTGVQTNLGFGTVGALAGLASVPVPIPGALIFFGSALFGLRGRRNIH